jgi:hypothetical protein
MKHGWSKKAFWYVNNKKWRKWCKFVSPFLFNNTYGLPVLTTDPKLQINYFIFDRLTYRLVVLNRRWKGDCFKIMIFVYVCSTWSLVELETRYDSWVTGNDVNDMFVSRFLFNNTYGVPVLTMVNKCPNQVFYVSKVDLQTISSK